LAREAQYDVKTVQNIESGRTRNPTTIHVFRRVLDQALEDNGELPLPWPPLEEQIRTSGRFQTAKIASPSHASFSAVPSQQFKAATLEVIERYGENELIEARAILWRNIREQAKRLGIADVHEVLALCKMPPNLPLETGDFVELALSFRDDPSKLDQTQRSVWNLVCDIYPWEHIEKSTIGMFGSEFDRARRALAYFWNDSVNKAEVAGLDIVAEIAHRIDAARHQVYILSWLELPLVLRTRDRGKGKVGLFKVGQCFQSVHA
jgi:hypothetical protein